MRTYTLWGAGLLLAMAPSGPALAQTPPPVPLPAITVEGSAYTKVVPDMARLTIGVELNRPTASAATADVAKAAQAMVDQVKAEGIEDKDVATGSVSLAPITPEPGITRAQRGFRASTDLTVTVRPADRAGTVASHLVDKGANTIDGIDYATSQEDKLTDDLRAEAMRDARHKAEIYVGALGVHLGRVLEITPNGGAGAYPPPPAAPRRMSVLAESAPTLPVSPGTLTLQSSVSVRWEVLP